MQGLAAGPLGRLNGRVTKWLAHLAAFILAVLALMTFADVFARYFLNRPFSFSVEITEIAMGLIVYFGLGYTTHEKAHICVDVVTLNLSELRRALVEFVTGLLSFAFLCLLVWQLWIRAQIPLEKGDMTPIMYIPLWPVAFAMAVASILLVTGTFLHLAASLQQVLRGRTSA